MCMARVQPYLNGNISLTSLFIVVAVKQRKELSYAVFERCLEVLRNTRMNGFRWGSTAAVRTQERMKR